MARLELDQRVWRTRARLRALKTLPLFVILFALGAISVLSYAPLYIPTLILGLTVLVLSLDDARFKPRPIRSAFFRGWAFASGYFLAGTYWVANAFLVNAADHAWLIWAPLTLFPGGLALFWGLAGAVYARLGVKGPGRIAVFVAVLMAVEYARSTVLSGFPWNLPAYVIEAGTPISQLASLIGAYGLSALILLAFASPAALIGPGRFWPRALPVLISMGLLGAGFTYGTVRLNSAETSQTGHVLRLVSSNTDQGVRTYDNRFEVLEEYLQLTTRPGLEEVDAVIWPEGAIPTFLLNDKPVLDAIFDVLPRGMRLVAGTPRWQEGLGDQDDQYFNALVVLEMGDRVYLEAQYDKAKLVPFGEANPLVSITRLAGIESLSYWGAAYSPGSGASQLDFAGLPPVMPLICYEAVYPDYIPSGEDRPDWILNISNDSWFGAGPGPAQHFNQVAYRAIETGLPIVRVASSGVTGLINPYGATPTSQRVVISRNIDVRLHKGLDYTLYARYSNLLWMIVSLLVLTGFIRLPIK